MASTTLSASVWVMLIAFGATTAHGHPQSGQAEARPSESRKQVKSPKGAETSKPDKPSREKRLLPAKAIDALRALAEDSKKWEASVAVADIQSQVADLIWDADPGTARGHLILAWETAARIEEKRQGTPKFRSVSSRTDARRRVLLIARKRSPQLAETWLEQMAQDSGEEQSGVARGVFDDRTARSAVLLQMAMSVIADNPKAAAELATESLRDGISFGLQTVLIALQEKDFELAQSVFRAALAKLRTSSSFDPDELLVLSAYLYTPGRIVGANTSESRGQFSLAMGRNQTAVVAAAQLSPGLSREFLELAANLLANAPQPSTTSDPQQTARKQISAIGFLIGRIARQFPEQADVLRRKAQLIEADARFSPTAPSANTDLPTPYERESAEDYAERRVNLLEESAKKETDPLGRDILYARAALATEAGRYERGLDLAGRIKDEQLRVGVSNLLIYRGTLHLIKSGEVDLAYKLSARNSDTAQRAISLVVGAGRLVKSKDLAGARHWLEEARKLSKGADPDDHWTRITLGIVSTYAKFDEVSALDSLSEAVNMIERSPDVSTYEEKAPLIKRFSGFKFSDFTQGTTGFGISPAVMAFSPEQFDNVLATLSRITRPEPRGVAVISLCRSYLLAERRRPLETPTPQSTTPENATPPTLAPTTGLLR